MLAPTLITKMSSKGQLVIPFDLRKELDVREGDLFAATGSKNDMIILKKLSSALSKEDIDFINETEQAWKEIDDGKKKTLSKAEFLKEMESW